MQCMCFIPECNSVDCHVLLWFKKFKYRAHIIQSNIYYKYEYYSPSLCANKSPLMHFLIVLIGPNRHRCNFGPEDKTGIVPQDMQALLECTQRKRKNNLHIHKKKRGKKVVPEYDCFPVNKAAVGKVQRIGKTLAGNSIKRGCQRAFVAKKPYLDNSLCLLIYENTEHLNTHGEMCHGTMLQGTRYALGAGLSEELKIKIAQMHAFGLSPAQIMQQHTKEVRELAIANGVVTRDTFLLPVDVRNICRKRAEELWEKHPSDPVSVRMWVMENPENVFYYQEHSLLDINSQVQNDSPFTLGVQTEWQLQMMIKFGHKSALSIDATFGTSQTRVSHQSMSFNKNFMSFHVFHVVDCLCVSGFLSNNVIHFTC